MKTLKAIGYLLTALLAIETNTLNAGNSNPVVKPTTIESNCLISCDLAPTPPKEADFNENPIDIETLNYDVLKPLAPKEAGFDETDENVLMNIPDYAIEKLAPVTPKEADFNDANEFNFIKDLKPVTPLYANFDEN